MLFLASRASRCGHNLPTHPGCLDSLIHPVVPAHWAVQCAQTVLVLHPWLTYQAVALIWSDFLPSSPFPIPSNPYSAPQHEVTSTFLNLHLHLYPSF